MALNPSRPWWRMGPVDPGEFAMLRAEDAVAILWNLCCAHGDAVGLCRALESRREHEAAATIEALIEDLKA